MVDIIFLAAGFGLLLGSVALAVIGEKDDDAGDDIALAEYEEAVKEAWNYEK